MRCTDQTCWKSSGEMLKNNLESSSQPCRCGEHSTCRAFLNQITSSPDRREIWWMDAETCGGPEWISADELCCTIRTAPPVMKTMGYVLFENDVYIALADSIGPDETSAINKIPKCMIVKSQNIYGGESNETFNRE